MPFDKVSLTATTDEGELVRYFRMAKQLLREIMANPQASDTLKTKISLLIPKINRDIVDAEKQLRAY